MVPLSEIIMRLTSHLNKELHEILETLSSLPDLAKKRKLLEYLRVTRERICRLFVLVQWARWAKDMKIASDVRFYLSGQRHCFLNSVRSIEAMHRQLSFARIRSPDITTALSVLSRGFDTGFPEQNVLPYKSVPKLKANVILDVLNQLERLLHVRLSLYEILPFPWRKYSVHDGRVRFTGSNWWVDLAISEAFGRWVFISFHTEEKLGKEVHDMLENMCNEILSRHENSKQELLDGNGSTAPLVELYNLLHRFSLSRVLESLNCELLKLKRHVLLDSIQVKQSPERDKLECFYWSGNSSISPSPERGGFNKIVFGMDSTANSPILDTILGKRITTKYDHSKLIVQWYMAPDKVQILPFNSAKAVIEDIVRRHCAHLLTELAISIPEHKLSESNSQPVLSFQIMGTPFRISVDPLSGRYFFLADIFAESPFLSFPNYIRAIERSLNNSQSRSSAVANFYSSLRAHVLHKVLTYRAVAAGLMRYQIIDVVDANTQNLGGDVLYFGKDDWIRFEDRQFFLAIKNGMTCQAYGVELSVRPKGGREKYARVLSWSEELLLEDSEPNIIDFQNFSRFLDNRFILLTCERDLATAGYHKYELKENSIIEFELQDKFDWLSDRVSVEKDNRKSGEIILKFSVLVKLQSLGEVLENFDMTEISYDQETNLLQVMVDPAVSESFVGVFLHQVRKINATIQLQTKATEFASNFGLKILQRNFQSVSFEYGKDTQMEVSTVKKEKSDYSICISGANNPHKPYQRLVSVLLGSEGDSLNTVTEILLLTAPLFTTIAELERESTIEMYVIVTGLTSLQIIYPSGPHALECTASSIQDPAIRKNAKLVFLLRDAAHNSKRYKESESWKSFWGNELLQENPPVIPVENGVFVGSSIVGDYLRKLHTAIVKEL